MSAIRAASVTGTIDSRFRRRDRALGTALSSRYRFDRRVTGSTDGVYRWVVVAAAAASMVFSWGTTYSFGVLIEPLAATYGHDTFTLSTVFSFELLAFYAVAGLVGVTIAGRNVRVVLAGLAVGMAGVSTGPAIASSYLGLAVVFAIQGLILGTTYVLLAAVVPQWFDDRRGLAVGVLVAGNGIGLQVLPPIWAWTIASLGFPDAFRLLTLAAAVTFGISALVVRSPPARDRDATGSGIGLLEVAHRLVLAPRFWWAFLGTGLLFAWYYMFSTYAVTLFSARGASRATASILFGAVGGVSIVSRVAGGVAGDRVGYRRTLLWSLLIVSLGFWLLIPGDWIAAYAAIACFGIGMGAIGTLNIPVLIDAFPDVDETAVLGAFNVSYGIFAFIAPPTSVWLIETTGGFDAVLALSGALALLAAFSFHRGTVRRG